MYRQQKLHRQKMCIRDRTKARDILCLFLEIEKRYGVIIGAEKINNPNFFTLKSIAIEVENEDVYKRQFIIRRIRS